MGTGGLPAVAGDPYVTGQTVGSLRNNFDGTAGFKFTTGATVVTIQGLGRWKVSGNTGTCILRLTQQSPAVEICSVTLDLDLSVVGQFNYAAVTPVALSTSKTYWMLGTVNAGGRQWYDDDTTITPTALGSMTHVGAAAGNADGISGMFDGTAGDRSYGPVSFKYTL